MCKLSLQHLIDFQKQHLDQFVTNSNIKSYQQISQFQPMKVKNHSASLPELKISNVKPVSIDNGEFDELDCPRITKNLHNPVKKS